MDETTSSPAASLADQELAEAVRVHFMSPTELRNWLAKNWWPLQEADSKRYEGVELPARTVWHFKTMEEKNRYDEQRNIEIEAAIARARR